MYWWWTGVLDGIAWKPSFSKDTRPKWVWCCYYSFHLDIQHANMYDRSLPTLVREWMTTDCWWMEFEVWEAKNLFLWPWSFCPFFNVRDDEMQRTLRREWDARLTGILMSLPDVRELAFNPQTRRNFSWKPWKNFDIFLSLDRALRRSNETCEVKVLATTTKQWQPHF